MNSQNLLAIEYVVLPIEYTSLRTDNVKRYVKMGIFALTCLWSAQ